eukprot:gnl/Trimastix_PCT/2093.p1 GENE.gnl/Trimastix_PCT/2093~~gnl/Trimastix_PCT/2093.p1  ORF type:complete len:675 (+),score=204.40 gnl/Trimastix_PCT/2093:78-2102(+)
MAFQVVVDIFHSIQLVEENLPILREKMNHVKATSGDLQLVTQLCTYASELARTSSLAELSTFLQFCFLAAKQDVITKHNLIETARVVLMARSIPDCSDLFGVFELNPDMFKDKKDIPFLLRFLNELMERMSPTRNEAFLGRIYMYLARELPLDHRSGLNLMGSTSRHVPHIDDEPPAEEEEDAILKVQLPPPEDAHTLLEIDPESPSRSVSPEPEPAAGSKRPHRSTSLERGHRRRRSRSSGRSKHRHHRHHHRHRRHHESHASDSEEREGSEEGELLEEGEQGDAEQAPSAKADCEPEGCEEGEMMEDDPDSQEPPPVIDFPFYQHLWNAEKCCHEITSRLPQSVAAAALEGLPALHERFTEHLEHTLATLEHLHWPANVDECVAPSTESVYPKFPSSANLLALQINDPEFRLSLLTEFAITLNAVLKWTPRILGARPVAPPLSDALRKRYEQCMQRVRALIHRAPRYAAAVWRFITVHEPLWMDWKESKCPSFVIQPQEDLTPAPTPPITRTKVHHFTPQQIIDAMEVPPVTDTAANIYGRIKMEDDPSECVEDKYKEKYDMAKMWKNLQILNREPAFFDRFITGKIGGSLADALENGLMEIGNQLARQAEEKEASESTTTTTATSAATSATTSAPRTTTTTSTDAPSSSSSKAEGEGAAMCVEEESTPMKE